ncbi:MAG: DNA-directed RNA polymerase subunit omega [candidate division Zixibacteria bacterium]|nr:DNA-directed RNA polymerase subunit omega [candidate division Zixibacteria bacterium]
MKKTQSLRYVPQEQLRKQILNTYEAVMVAARAARLMNIRLNMVGVPAEREEKVTTVALHDVLDGQVRYTVKPKLKSGS